jgi:hypothetical protein
MRTHSSKKQNRTSKKNSKIKGGLTCEDAGLKTTSGWFSKYCSPTEPVSIVNDKTKNDEADKNKILGIEVPEVPEMFKTDQTKTTETATEPTIEEVVAPTTEEVSPVPTPTTEEVSPVPTPTNEEVAPVPITEGPKPLTGGKVKKSKKQSKRKTQKKGGKKTNKSKKNSKKNRSKK